MPFHFMRFKKVGISLACFFLFFLLYRVLIHPTSDVAVLTKLQLLEDMLDANGYRSRYFVISGKRNKWYNDLINGAPRSLHLSGKAIDIWVVDIDGDWDFDNNDIRILEKLNAKIEATHPELTGAFGTYRKASCLDRNMVHIDTRGRTIRYDLQ